MVSLKKKFKKTFKKPCFKAKGEPRKKKALGQNFLKKASVVENMVEKVKISPETTVMEIGCGDGFLTKRILETDCKELRCFEVDSEWIGVVKGKIKDPRLKIKHRDILDLDWKAALSGCKQIVLLANLPYQITFPILFHLKDNKHLFKEGVFMVQEEVAQKLVAKRGKKFNHISMMLAFNFDFELVEKVEPSAFVPAPKVFSRTVYFKPKKDVLDVADEKKFWSFVKNCFSHPRQTLKNNLKKAGFKEEEISLISQDVLSLRAQNLDVFQFVELFKTLNP